MNLILFDEKEIVPAVDPGTKPSEFTILISGSDQRAAHLRKVLKADTGTEFDAGIVNGMRGKAVIRLFNAESLLLEFRPVEKPAGLHPITLILGLSRPQTVKKIIREGTALGIERFILAVTDRGEKAYAGAGALKPESLRKLFIEGAEQAFCTMLPEAVICENIDKAVLIAEPAVPDNFLFALDNYEAETSLTAWWDARRRNEKSLYIGHRNAPAGVVLAVGSERGWTGRERNVFRRSGYKLVSAGPRVLRTETATVAGTAICLSGMGLI